jgi:hypothetical protein
VTTALDAFFAERDLIALGKAAGWIVARATNSEVVYLTLNARDGQTYRVQCACDGYPSIAPSVKFVDANGSSSEPVAWPKGAGSFHEEVKPPPNCFLCMPLTREGLHHHPDWRTNPDAEAWNGERHTLIDIFNRLKRLLNSPNYVGRGP